jgi:hypothetical protein
MSWTHLISFGVGVVWCQPPPSEPMHHIRLVLPYREHVGERPVWGVGTLLRLC